jgi:hypothetical protein
LTTGFYVAGAQLQIRRSGRVLGNAAAEGPVLLRDWLAANTDAWIWYLHDFRRVLDVIAPWRAAGDGDSMIWKKWR